MEEVVNTINELHLHSLDDIWVENVAYSEYLEFEEVSTDHDALYFLNDLFQNIIEALDAMLSMEIDDEKKSWATLAHNVPYKKLLAVLGYCVNKGSKNVMDEELRTRAILSSRVYFKLLSMPGYIAYNVYHSQLFSLTLACIGFPKMLSEKFEEQSKSKHDKVTKIEKEAKMRKLRQQVNSLIKQLQLFVVDLRAIMEQLQLVPNDMNFENILNNLVEVIGGSIVNKLNVDRIELARLTQVIYEVIHILVCDENNQPDAIAVSDLLKCLHGKLIAVCLDPRPSNEIVRASYVSYAGVVLSRYGVVALENFQICLEHLCYSLDGLERGETRAARVQMVTGLMSFLPGKVHEKHVKWIINLSQSSKVVHRQLAVDILDKMLSYNDNGKPLTIEANVSGQGDSTEAENTNVMEVDQQNKGDGQNSGEETAQVATGPVNPDPEVTEMDLQEILHERTITVPYREILHAMYDRVQDTSGAVRNRAVVVLTKCLENRSPAMKQAIQEMQGDGDVSRLMALAARCVCDERASVRRAAVLLVQRLLLMQDASPTVVDLAILVGLCRDASIIVRAAAIQAIGELVLKRPTATVFDAFLLGPMHQLSDPETKVKETVKSMLQKLLISRLKKYSLVDEDPIPWMLLAGVARNNMRRHLQKACSLLANDSTNCISVRLVDCLSSHLGALGCARDLQTLVMLTSVARHVQYPDIGFALQYYYRLVDIQQSGKEESDPRLMPLVLDLLSMWSRFARPDERIALRENLVTRLASPSDDGCRIACVLLAAQLDTSNLAWSTELMHIAERSALNGGEVEEWLRASDLSLVSPTPPTPELLQLYLNMIKNPPAGWDPRQAGECVAGVGRLCVRSRAAAAATAPAAAELLHADVPLQARVNALLVLADICTRYANIVDPLLDSISRCLEREKPPELRRHTVRALTRLLLAEYLRLRTPLYYKYCALIADDDHDVREPVEYYMTSILTSDTIAKHFVDCINYYNSDASEISFDARQLIYDVMLQRLTLVQRLNTQCLLAREILQNAADMVDDGKELSQSSKSVILDTITVLCGPRMRLPAKRQASATNDFPDVEELQERVTKNIVSQKMKNTVAEVVIPAVLRLHAGLRSGGGQLVAYLVRLATDLLNDYRSEIEDHIQTDEELVEHISQFQENIGLEPAKGNARNLVTSSAPPDAETPRAPRRRTAACSPTARESLRKRI